MNLIKAFGLSFTALFLLQSECFSLSVTTNSNFKTLITKGALVEVQEREDNKYYQQYSQLSEDEQIEKANRLNEMALLYYDQGRYSEAEPLYLQSLELYKKLLGKEHPKIAASLNNLAEIYKSQGRYSEAEPLYEKALEIAETKLGMDHPNTNRIRKNLQANLEAINKQP